MAKRASLASALDVATTAKGAKPSPKRADSDAPNKGKIGNQSGRDKTTAITLSSAHWDTLRAVAAKRAADQGGRNSVSGVIGELIADNLDKLETEAGPFLKLYKGKS